MSKPPHFSVMGQGLELIPSTERNSMLPLRLVNNEIANVYRKNSEFAKFLTEFLSGKPKWLEVA